MNEASPFQDPSQPDINGKRTLPGSVNVLTILTFIGCGIGAIFTVLGYFSSEKSYQDTSKAFNSGEMDKLPSFMKNMVNESSLEVMRKTAENKLPILIIGLAALFLCVYGAMQMRKLLKQGFYIWLIGELIPLVASVIFIGTAAFAGFGIIGIIIPVIFIILYSTQLKYMK